MELEQVHLCGHMCVCVCNYPQFPKNFASVTNLLENVIKCICFQTLCTW